MIFAETPGQAAFGKEKCEATFHEWQTDILAAAAANAQLQGDDVSFATPAYTTRVGNRTQIVRKDVITSGTTDQINKAGRKSEMVYQLAKKAKELRRDLEFVLFSNQVPTTGNSTTAQLLRPMLSWFATNVQGGVGAANGSTTIPLSGSDVCTGTLVAGPTVMQRCCTPFWRATWQGAGWHTWARPARPSSCACWRLARPMSIRAWAARWNGTLPPATPCWLRPVAACAGWTTGGRWATAKPASRTRTLWRRGGERVAGAWPARRRSDHSTGGLMIVCLPSAATTHTSSAPA